MNHLYKVEVGLKEFEVYYVVAENFDSAQRKVEKDLVAVGYDDARRRVHSIEVLTQSATLIEGGEKFSSLDVAKQRIERLPIDRQTCEDCLDVIKELLGEKVT